MVPTALAFLLGCSPLQDKQPLPKLEPVVRESPAAAGQPAGFIVEGSTGYPAGSWLQIMMHFDYKDDPTLVRIRTQIQPGGTFSAPVSYFDKKVLAGNYVFTIEFNRFLQPSEFARLPSQAVDVPYRSGTVMEAQQDRREWKKKLLSEFQKALSIVEEIEALQRETLVKQDPARWKKASAEWDRSLRESQALAMRGKEYRAYRDLYGIAHTHLEPLHANVMQLAALGARGQEAVPAAREGHTKIAALAAPHIAYLSKTDYTPALLRALAEDTRRIARESSAASGDALADSRSKVSTALLELGANVPETQRVLVRVALEAAVPYFAAVEAGAPNARELLVELDLRIQKLAAGLPAEK